MKSARTVILSDTHGFLDPRVAQLVAECDFAVHAGDVGAGNVLDALRPRCSVIAVRGNNDTPAHWPRSQWRRLQRLPLEGMLELPGGVLAVEHGHRAASARTRHEWLRARYPDVRVIAYGHSHHLLCDRSASPWVVNPGAAGRIRTCGGPSCLVLEASASRWEISVIRFELRSRQSLG